MHPATTPDTRVVSDHAHRRLAGSRPRSSWASPELVARARSGDRNALGQLHGVAWPRLIAFYRYSGLDQHSAEDLAAETTERIIKRLTTLRDTGAFESWMWTIARNRLRTHRRVANRTTIERPGPQPPEPHDQLELSEDHREIRVALGLLNDRDRALLWLREVEGLSYREIGGRLGAATGSVRVAVHRARTRLQRAYEGGTAG